MTGRLAIFAAASTVAAIPYALAHGSPKAAAMAVSGLFLVVALRRLKN